ncbi:MAG: DNA methyltransferase [Verrucomicrobiota bacterium]|nr:DNA methyltransferase [Verrucomicrobiota bacterium]
MITSRAAPLEASTITQPLDLQQFKDYLADFREFGEPTRIEHLNSPAGSIPVFINEFWTSRQRAACSLHEVSYRACFKPQLPRFFIERLTTPGEIVYDPFMGRGTTLIEAALLRRVPFGCDINPLSQIFAGARLHPPTLTHIQQRLEEISFNRPCTGPPELLAFYHPATLQQINALRHYFMERERTGTIDYVDRWIQMVATNRLTGHSTGFFSVYTLPPNQAVSVKSQIKINATRRQVPPPRDVPKIILKKSRQLLSKLTPQNLASLRRVAEDRLLITGFSSATPQIKNSTISLVVTSPPFLDIVDYRADNWLRCWFLGIDPAAVQVTTPRSVDQWQAGMTTTFSELNRVLRRGGQVAFEVGEVRKGTVRLEEVALKAGLDAGLQPAFILINAQQFTKTANCWGISNNSKGTNSNRIVLFSKK